MIYSNLMKCNFVNKDETLLFSLPKPSSIQKLSVNIIFMAIQLSA